MANPSNTTNPSETRALVPVDTNRRQLIKWVPAGLAVAAAAAIVGPGVAETKMDARLISLAAEYERIDGLYASAARKLDEAEIAAADHYPWPPDDIKGYFTMSGQVGRDDVQAEYLMRQMADPRHNPFLRSKEQGEKLLKKNLKPLEAYRAERRKVDTHYDVPKLTEERNRLSVCASEIEEEMTQTPAQSMAGVAAKLRVWAIDQAVDEIAASAAQDAERLGRVS